MLVMIKRIVEYKICLFIPRKGSIESSPAKAMTYSSSPTGLAAPTLTPLSSTSIKVDWLPPANPNGQLTNYSIYEGQFKYIFYKVIKKN